MADINDDCKPNVRSAKYIIVQSAMCCPQCNLVSKVFAFALPAGYESFSEDGDDDEPGTWEAPGFATVLSYVERLPEAIARRIRAITSHYRLDLHRATGQSFWMNHCEHCGAQVEEEELGEFEGPFGPTPAQGLEAIQLHRVYEPFTAWAAGESHSLMPLDS